LLDQTNLQVVCVWFYNNSVLRKQLWSPGLNDKKVMKLGM